MARTHIIAILTSLIFTMALSAQDLPDSTYVDISPMPNATAFLPAPPDTACRDFAGDFMRWQWGKTLRSDSNRGTKANLDTQLGIERTKDIYGTILGIDIDSVSTPAMYRLLKMGGDTAIAITAAAKDSIFRKRPFVQMNEHSWGDHESEAELRASSSYPSAHAAVGWATALLLAEIAGSEQDAIFFNGFDYGTSRVISGANWQSDVEAGQLCGAAAVAYMHTSAECASALAEAKSEYLMADSLTQNENGVTTMPNGNVFISAPADTLSREFVSNIVNYWQAKTLREGERGLQAIADADSTTVAYMNAFMSIICIDPSDAPSLVQVITQVTDVLRQSAREMKSSRPRWRPYVKLKEPTLIDSDEAAYRASSSHPSEAAQIGWGLALIMAEVAPGHQDEILKRGYEFGESRIIAGYQYASDVAAGRTMAAAIVSRMHADSDFAALLSAAKDEYITSVQP